MQTDPAWVRGLSSACKMKHRRASALDVDRRGFVRQLLLDRSGVSGRDAVVIDLRLQWCLRFLKLKRHDRP